MISEPANGVARVLALLLALTLSMCSGCRELVVDKPVRGDNKADFETAWSVVRDVYPFLRFKQIDWDRIHAVYGARAEVARGDEILSVLFEMLAELRDGHVSLVLPSGVSISTYQIPRSQRDQRLFDPLIVRKYCSKELNLSSDKKMEYGVLDGNIGYIRLTTFVQGAWVYEFGTALERLRNTTGLIIDIRHNGGGSTNTADAVIARFIEAPLAYPPRYVGGQLLPTVYLQSAGPFLYSHRVVVLINGVCFSAAEYFVEMMKQLPAVVAVGDTTGGGGGIPEMFSLPGGAEVWIPSAEYRRFDGIPHEWNGIPPDVRIANSEADIQAGIDLQLAYAMSYLRIP